MKRAGTNEFLIDQVAQVRALAAPTRQEIVDALQAIGAATVAELGAMLGRAPDSLYHHIRILLAVGLVRKARARGTSLAREAVYELPSGDMRLAYNLQDPAMTAAVNAVVRAMSRIAYRDFERAALKGEAVVEGPRRNLRASRFKSLLSAAQIEEINRLHQRIVEIMNAPHRGGGSGQMHAVTFLMSPLPRSRRAKAAVPLRMERRKG